MQKAAVGFYWTLPVPWAGFISLPADVDAAAKESRTIRYQREVIRRYARESRLRLVHEEVFLELEPDRASDVVWGPFLKAMKLCLQHDARLLLVDFSPAHGWRGHGPLTDLADEATAEGGVDVLPLPPEPVYIDGQLFDPIKHFTGWRERQAAWTAEKPQRRAALIQRARALRKENLPFTQVAERLTAEGHTTPTGKPVTPDTVRKMLNSGGS